MAAQRVELQVPCPEPVGAGPRALRPEGHRRPARDRDGAARGARTGRLDGDGLDPEGIDTGFGYNPGDSWMRGVTPPELRKTLPPPDVPAPASPPPPMPAPRHPGVTSMPDGLAEEGYVRAFLQPFGADIGRPVLWRDPSGSRITLSDELFRNSLGELKVTKFDRRRQILALAMAILDPDEVWVDWQNIAPKDAAPKWRLRRRYIRRFDMDGRKGGIATFGWMGQGWSGATAFPPDTVSYLDRQRTGVLLYQRP
ncbi:hypothetical protein KXS07_30620 [Inquilinus limosus]|uniref:PBECR2 nuclease fold domain-containing protein n=1 Tax=Inquilinus limosus TaxID=171674 RepID=UPI003F14CE33